MSPDRFIGTAVIALQLLSRASTLSSPLTRYLLWQVQSGHSIKACHSPHSLYFKVLQSTLAKAKIKIWLLLNGLSDFIRFLLLSAFPVISFVIRPLLFQYLLASVSLSFSQMLWTPADFVFTNRKTAQTKAESTSKTGWKKGGDVRGNLQNAVLPSYAHFWRNLGHAD